VLVVKNRGNYGLKPGGPVTSLITSLKAGAVFENQPQLLSWGLDEIKGKRLIHARSKENKHCMSRKMK
jgi:hypothetical protein